MSDMCLLCTRFESFAVVLIKEAIKLAFFRLVEYLENQHLWVCLQAQNGQKQSTFF
jgi:hypothetical protein